MGRILKKGVCSNFRKRKKGFFLVNLLKLYKNESTVSGNSILFMAIVSGIAQGLLLGIITTAAATASYDKLNFRYFLIFVITFAIVIVGKRYALIQATAITEGVIKQLRVRLSDKIRHSELLFLENIGKAEIYTRTTYNTNLISEAAALIINAAQSGIVLFFCLFYICFLSKLAFFITLLAIGAAAFNYILQQKKIDKEMRETANKESNFFDMLNQTLDGFKELKVNTKKSDDLFSTLKKIADETENLKLKTGFKFVTELMFSQVFFYTLLGIIVFVLPRLDPANPSLIIRLTAAILFLIGPVNMLVGAIPLFSRANMAVEILYELEEWLDKANKPYKIQGTAHIRKIASFNELQISDLSFSYTDDNQIPLFTVGPTNLTIKKGEIIFIVGGNGSGKSTLMKLLTGLYYPDSGNIRLDNLTIDKTSYQAYREMFSIIFNDFHIFDKLYGLSEKDFEKIQSLIQLMELEKKTEVIDGKFTNINLSTGQRKRLAMIISLLEDRPICVFDEWAADQDPAFRNYFYETLLSDLKSQGKTIIAVSHDDRYFSFADRVLKMEYGQFIETKQRS
ncbi:peptide ABC transporter ATP-binding protein [Candidatus Magnetomorum sp. HK-1]|nr:peptide ABC transporter ATP-binding protein [Candidatus Magnetomorum sp. HK-1]